MNRSIYTRFLLPMIAFLTLGFGWTSIASADFFSIDQDSKFYPATTCVKKAGPNRLVYDRDGSIFNHDTTQSILVHCPILRDYVMSDTHLVQVVVNIGRANLKKCWIRVIQPKKTKNNAGYVTLAKAYESDVKHSLRGGGKYYLLKFNRQQNFTRGALYMLGCELAPKSRMIGYSALERD